MCEDSVIFHAGYRIFYQFEYLTYNIYYKDFSHPCISAEGDTILSFWAMGFSTA
jgi:hypothetical protein